MYMFLLANVNVHLVFNSVLTSMSGKEKVCIVMVYVYVHIWYVCISVAFDAVSPPSCPPSLCMRLKNMFDSTMLVASVLPSIINHVASMIMILHQGFSRREHFASGNDFALPG